MKPAIPSSLKHISSGHILTGTGKLFSLENPTAAMVDIEDIAGALSKMCRWNGNIPEFYSVAQHSCMVAWLAPPALSLAALLHDAPEAYTGDIIRPLKKLLAQAFNDIEKRIELAVCDHFMLSPVDFDNIAEYDNMALNIEFEAFHHDNKGARQQIRTVSAMHLNTMPAHDYWSPEEGFYAFLNTFKNISREYKQVFCGSASLLSETA
jgi:hypothetical protein